MIPAVTPEEMGAAIAQRQRDELRDAGLPADVIAAIEMGAGRAAMAVIGYRRSVLRSAGHVAAALMVKHLIEVLQEAERVEATFGAGTAS